VLATDLVEDPHGAVAPRSDPVAGAGTEAEGGGQRF
jgi:hypothetical protein